MTKKNFALTKKSVWRIAISLLYLCFVFISYFSGFNLQYMFVIGAVIIYILMMPSKLLNPKNIVFGFYFMWYGVAPLLASRYENLKDNLEIANKAFLMCFCTYAIAMITLEIMENKYKNYRAQNYVFKIKLLPLEKMALFFLFLIALSIYIEKTGGLSLWLTDANEAFFNRRGSGGFYLIFEYSLLILLFEYGNQKNKTILKNIAYISICLCGMFFCGSKSTALLMLLILFSEQILKLKLKNPKSLIVIGVGIAVFIAGMYIRLRPVITDLAAIISTSLNYFDTFDELMLSLEEIPPSWGSTVLLPLNWVLMKLGGYYINVPYHDMSIWLTTIYYPDSWINGGTHQWPIETDMYLSFNYWGGIPFLILYFIIIGIVYRNAEHKKGVWGYIYIIEMMNIISHLRGGLFIYWYWYLIPMYIVLLLRFRRKEFRKDEKNGCKKIEMKRYTCS